MLLALFRGSFLLRFHRLPEPITFAIHLEDMALVREPVEQRRPHPFSLEHLPPLAKRQVARNQQEQATPLVAIREYLEQAFRSGPAERQVSKLIDGQ